MKKYTTTKNNTIVLDNKLALLERDLINKFENRMLEKGYTYLSIPSTVSLDTYRRQGVVPLDRVITNGLMALTGSAEQGILEAFADQYIENETRVFATNQCFRVESKYSSLVRLLEFKKVEQFGFCRSPISGIDCFYEFLENAKKFLSDFDIEHRVVDMTMRDDGYHQKKKDIEIFTKTFGWVESHSCSYFGDEQSNRFNIEGAKYTVSCTGIASPRILIPFIEKEIEIKNENIKY